MLLPPRATEILKTASSMGDNDNENGNSDGDDREGREWRSLTTSQTITNMLGLMQ